MRGRGGRERGNSLAMPGMDLSKHRSKKYIGARG